MKSYFFTIVVLLICAEVFARFVLGLGQEILFIEDKEYEYIYAPNQEVERFGNEFVTNSYSMRNHALRPNAKKILLFGDSVLTGGSATPHSSLATALLQEDFEKKLNQDIDILNIAAPSWGTDNAYSYLKKHGDFGALAIVLVFSSHDAYDTMVFNKIVGNNQFYQNTQPVSALHDGFRRYVYPKLKNLFVTLTSNQKLQIQESKEFSTGWQNFIDYSKENNIPLMVVLHATVKEIEQKEYNENGKEILALLERNNIPHLKELDYNVSKSFFRQDGQGIHYNLKGQRFLYKELKSLILDSFSDDDTDIDASFLLQDLAVDTTKSSVKVKDIESGKVLIDSKNKPFFLDKSDNKLNISYKIEKKQGGFDVIYNVLNNSKNIQIMPDFQIPGINFTTKNQLEVLNTNTEHYMQTRDLNQIKREGKKFISVSSVIRRDFDGKVNEYECHYGASTFTPYSPVISAKDKNFAIGTSLNYPILKYVDSAKDERGEHHVLRDKLYPKMRIYKDSDSWRFSYSFAKSGPISGRIETGKNYKFTIPVRFSKPKSWLFTLSPYKKYFSTLYPITNPSLKDVKPILGVNFSFYGDSIREKSKRGWAWALENVDKDGYSYLPLKQVSHGLSTMMEQKGYERILFFTFSGVYNTMKSPKMYSELPFQFITNFEPNMQKELDESLKIYTSKNQKIGFWWGIAGMMPIDDRGELISDNKWLPSDDTPFILENPEHKRYAYRQLKVASEHSVDSLTLDAYVRMEENSAIEWLKEMKAYDKDIKFVLEQQVDFMHTLSAIILQPENLIFDNSDLRYNMLTQPALFSHYLNPTSEVQVWLQQKVSGKNENQYIKDLVSWGYTPIVPMPDSDNFNHDQRDVTKRILDNPDDFQAVHNLDNSSILACCDGKDNDGDGKVDWPYDEGCESAMDDSE